MRFVVIMGLLGGLAALAGAPGVTPAMAQTYQQDAQVSQSTRQRITVTPRRSNPGPNARRECEARLVEQHRPSGTVVVPVMNCWWQ